MSPPGKETRFIPCTDIIRDLKTKDRGITCSNLRPQFSTTRLKISNTLSKAAESKALGKL